MGTFQQFGYNLHVLYNLCIIYIYNQASIFSLNHRTALKNLAAWCDETEFHVTALRYFPESLPLVTVFTEGTSTSFCSGSCLRYDVNVESKKLSGEGLFKDLYTLINPLPIISLVLCSHQNGDKIFHLDEQKCQTRKNSWNLHKWNCLWWP